MMECPQCGCSTTNGICESQPWHYPNWDKKYKDLVKIRKGEIMNEATNILAQRASLDVETAPTNNKYLVNKQVAEDKINERIGILLAYRGELDKEYTRKVAEVREELKILGYSPLKGTKRGVRAVAEKMATIATGLTKS